MRAEEDDVGDQDGEDDGQSCSRRELAAHAEETGHRDQHGDRAAENHDLSVQADTTGNNRSQTQQRRQVEHVRAEDDSGADRRLVVRQRRDGGGDLGCIGRNGGHHAEQGFGEPQALADPFEARNEHPTGGQTHDSPDDKGQERESYAHCSESVLTGGASAREW